jgi:predicted amidohydrolase YtcJ
MCIVCGPGGTRLAHSIAASFGAPGGRARPRFMAEEVIPAFVPPLDPANLEELNGPADIILRGGPILTMREADDAAQAIAVRAGRIQAVGDEETALALQGRLTRIIDLDGRALLPGFVVADWHPPISLLCDWLEANETPAATLAAAVADRSGEWLALTVRGPAMDRSLSALLSAAARPVLTIDETGTVLTANAPASSLAPELVAVESKAASTPHVSALLPAFLRRMSVSSAPIGARLRALLGQASRNGVTTLRYCGLGALGGEDNVSLLRSAVSGSPSLRLRGSMDERLALEKDAGGLRAGAGDDMFRVDTATRWIDEAPVKAAELAGAIAALRKQGWRVTLHASSPGAIDAALEAFATAASAGTPLGAADGLEYRVPLSARASARLYALGLSAGLRVEERAQSIETTENFEGLTGIPVSASLDRMAGPPSPLRTIASLARRELPWVTREAAMRCGMGQIVGSLDVGMYADFAFLDEDPRAVAPEDFGHLRCVATWVSGREIHP